MNGDWHNRRRLMAALSFTLMAGVAIAAFHIVPRPLSSRQYQDFYTVLGSIHANLGDGPIFTLDDGLFPHQCGKALFSAGSTLALRAYDIAVCRESLATSHPYLLAADLRVPWAIVPSAEREELRHFAGVLIAQWEKVGQRLLQSSFFERSYAPVFKDILRHAFNQAMTAPVTDQALTKAVTTFDRRQIDQIIEGILPIFLEKAKKNFWQTLHGSISAIFGGDDIAQREAMAQLGAEVFSDPRTQEHLARTIPPLLTSREAMRVSLVMARESAKAILGDQRMLSLVGQLLTDQHFLGLQPFSAELEQFVRVLPVRLMRLRYRFDHNPLATYILRNMVRGRSGFLVLLLTPQQEQLLSNSDLPSGPALRKITIPY